MSNLFSSYLIIDAESIVRSNIRRDYIREDLKSLLEALKHFDYLEGSNIRKGLVLGRDTVKKLDAKRGLIELLEFYGFERERSGEFVYEPAETRRGEERRKNAASDVKKLAKELRRARDDSMEDLKEFIQNRRSYVRPDPIDNPESDDEVLLPPRNVEARNFATLATIKSFKESLVTEYDANPSPSFIRRRLARLTLRNKSSDPHQFDDNIIDMTIDAKVASLKEKYHQRNLPMMDQVCIECLIRANFDENEALKLLRNNPPNLEPPAPPVPQRSTQTPLVNVIEPLKQHYRQMNQQNNNNNELARQLSRSDDVWESVKYIVPAIQKIRKKSPDATAGDVVYSQLYRLLHSELLPKVGQQVAFKIEVFARIICDSSLENIENLDINAVKNIFTLGADNFDQSVRNFLSMQCPTCGGYFPRNQMESMFLCDHLCCLECVKGYYRARINDVQDVKTLSILTCVITPHEITPEIYMTFFTLIEVKLNQWFRDEPEFLQRYHNRKFDATRGTQVKSCGGPNCASSFFVDANDPIASSRCINCQFAQCRKCGKKWNQVHTGMTCDEYTDWLAHDDPEHPDNLAVNYLGSDGIVCPNCREIFLLQRGGCEHFTCPSCRTNFCRTCSALYYSQTRESMCPRKNCPEKMGFHAHCAPNCYRELRDENVESMIELLQENGIDVEEELDNKPVSTNGKCSTAGCTNDLSPDTGNRLCATCYRYFLCSLIWTHQLKPWKVYDDGRLRRLLEKEAVAVPAKATRANLITLCTQHLDKYLGKPQKLR